jgi:hypothetical protein
MPKAKSLLIDDHRTVLGCCPAPIQLNNRGS